MKGLTLTQPWASLVALGEKHFETRSWSTHYRGPIAIHAAKRYPAECRDLGARSLFEIALSRHGLQADTLPLGRILAVGDLIRCVETELIREAVSFQEVAFGDYSKGRFAFQIENVRPVHQTRVDGMLGLWEVDPGTRVLIDTPLEVWAKAGPTEAELLKAGG